MKASAYGDKIVVTLTRKEADMLSMILFEFNQVFVEATTYKTYKQFATNSRMRIDEAMSSCADCGGGHTCDAHLR